MERGEKDKKKINQKWERVKKEAFKKMQSCWGW